MINSISSVELNPIDIGALGSPGRVYFGPQPQLRDHLIYGLSFLQVQTTFPFTEIYSPKFSGTFPVIRAENTFLTLVNSENFVFVDRVPLLYFSNLIGIEYKSFGTSYKIDFEKSFFEGERVPYYRFQFYYYQDEQHQ